MKEFIEKLTSCFELAKKTAIVNIKDPVTIDSKCKLQEFTDLCFDTSISIVNQLAEEYKPKTNEDIQEVIDCLEVYTAGRLNTSKVEISVLQLQRYINKLKQISEEYNNDFCEWNYSPFNGDVIKPYHHKGSVGMYKECLKSNPFCSCCGKKIKLVKPKGE